MLLSYSLISSIILIFCYAAYLLLMRDKRQHSANRFTLLMIYAASLTIPVCVLAFLLHTTTAVGVADIEIGELSTGIIEGSPALSFLHSISLSRLLYKIYLAGVVIMACYYIFALIMLKRLVAKGDCHDYEHFSLILIDDSFTTAPFNWRHSIAMRKSDYAEDGDMILIHEYAHLKLRHWIDLIAAYITICMQWYNPAAWAMRNELRAIHEYQADESVIEQGVDAKEYQMLLLKQAVGSRYQSFANSLNHSKLKKRVTMMCKKKTSKRSRLFALALIPAIGAGIAVSSIPSVAGVLESLATTATVASAATPEATPAAAASEKDVYVAVETQAEFPGGMDGLFNYLRNNIRYPEEAMKANLQGRVIVKFIINEDGTVSDAAIVKGVSESLDREALRVVSSMPNWIPAKVNENNVARYVLRLEKPI